MRVFLEINWILQNSYFHEHLGMFTYETTIWVKVKLFGGLEHMTFFRIRIFLHFSGLQRKREPQFFREGLTPCRTLKGIIKWAEPCKCGILLVSRILWHERIKPSLKEWRFSYLILTGHFPPKSLLSSLHSAIPVKAAYFHRKKLVT